MNIGEHQHEIVIEPIEEPASIKEPTPVIAEPVKETVSA